MLNQILTVMGKMKSLSCVYEVYFAKENGNETVFKFCGATETVVCCTTVSILSTIGISNLCDNSFPSP